jgi:hypothetical protein
MTTFLLTQLAMVFIAMLTLSIAIKKCYCISVSKIFSSEEKITSIIVMVYLLISIAAVLATTFSLCEGYSSNVTFGLFFTSLILNSLVLFYDHVVLKLAERIQF